MALGFLVISLDVESSLLSELYYKELVLSWLKDLLFFWKRLKGFEKDPSMLKLVNIFLTVDVPIDDIDDTLNLSITDDYFKVSFWLFWDDYFVFSSIFFFLGSILNIFYLTFSPTNLDSLPAHWSGAGIFTDPAQL